ncbi:MAG: hypothetical protein ACUVV5_06895 [Candidatus Aminicenantales bacterium]
MAADWYGTDLAIGAITLRHTGARNSILVTGCRRNSRKGQGFPPHEFLTRINALI